MVLGYIHGMLHFRRSTHLVVIRLAFFLLKLLLVQFLWKDHVRLWLVISIATNEIYCNKGVKTEYLDLQHLWFWQPLCCGRCHGFQQEWWSRLTGDPFCWPPCIWSAEKVVNCNEFKNIFYGSLMNLHTLQHYIVPYLRRKFTHWFSMKDLRSVMDRNVLAFGLLILLLVFHLKNRDIFISLNCHILYVDPQKWNYGNYGKWHSHCWQAQSSA